MISQATRARTIAATSTMLEIGILDRTETLLRHALSVDGSLLFLAPPTSPLNAAALMAQSPLVTATAADLAPIAVADRVRGRVVFGGRPRPVTRRLPAPLVSFLCDGESAPRRPLLELTPTSIQLRWHVETDGEPSTPVDLRDYADAQPDPMAGHEGTFVRHLDEEHASLLASLAAYAGAAVGEGGRVRPVLADSDGLVLRVSHDGHRPGHRDVRLRFDRPARCGCEAVESFNLLLERAERSATTAGD